MEIAPGVTDADWKRLREQLSPDTIDATLLIDGVLTKLWVKAVDIFRSRIESRYIMPVDCLIDIHRQQKEAAKHDRQMDHDRIRPGFAILALDFIIIETIQGFRSGLLDHKGQSELLISNFLLESPEFPDVKSESFAHFIYKAFRCQITHKGQTDGEFLVNDSGDSSINRRNYNSTSIDRNKFHKSVCLSFSRYCSELMEPSDTGRDLRSKFLAKMDSICTR